MKKEFLCVIFAGCLTLLVGGCTSFDFDQYYAFLDVVGPRPLGEVNPKAWAQLKVGMTEGEVQELLGWQYTASGAPGEPMVLEYGWTDGPALSPSPRAHVVYFDRERHVTSFRAPTESRTPGDGLRPMQSGAEGPRSSTLKAPVPTGPSDRSVFSYYPREIVLRWNPGPNTPADAQYHVQIDIMVRPDGYPVWESGIAKTAKTTYNYSHGGAQPGRWRVKACDASGESDWCEWQNFDFTM